MLNVQKIEELIIQLFQSVSEDENSDENEHLRSELDDIWSNSNQSEQSIMSGLLSDLNMLNNCEMVHIPTKAGLPTNAKEIVENSIISECWVETLALLRGGSIGFNRSEIAKIRSEAYAKLGFNRISRMFLNQIQ